MKQQHSDGMDQLAVRRVEPRQELRRDEVQVPRIAALEEPRRERPVVPGAVEPGHPGRELALGFQSEANDRDCGNEQRD